MISDYACVSLVLCCKQNVEWCLSYSTIDESVQQKVKGYSETFNGKHWTAGPRNSFVNDTTILNTASMENRFPVESKTACLTVEYSIMKSCCLVTRGSCGCSQESHTRAPYVCMGIKIHKILITFCKDKNLIIVHIPKSCLQDSGKFCYWQNLHKFLNLAQNHQCKSFCNPCSHILPWKACNEKIYIINHYNQGQIKEIACPWLCTQMFPSWFVQVQDDFSMRSWRQSRTWSLRGL